MASGIYNLKRDFQKSPEMGWHKLTIIGKPTREDFPEIIGLPLYYNGGKEMVFGTRKFLVPVSQDDMLPVAPPYCGETIIDTSTEKKGCIAKEEDKRGTYILFTPREAWDWVTDILSGTEYDVQSIGMLWNRSYWFISVNLKELKEVSIGDGRISRFQLNFSGGLDRSISPQAELSNTVVVCANTLNISRTTGKILFRERATKNFSNRLESSKSEVEKAVGMAAIFKITMDGLATKKCNQDRARQVFAGFVTPAIETKMSTRTSNMVNSLTELHKTGISNRGESEFDMLNAYTQLLTRGNDDGKTSVGRRFASSEFGNNADSKARFFKLLTNESPERPLLKATEFRGKELLAAK